MEGVGEEGEGEDSSPLEVSSTSVSPMKKRICLKVSVLVCLLYPQPKNVSGKGEEV